MKKPVKREYFGECRDLTYLGLGVLKDGEDTVFVEGMFPGDEGSVGYSYSRSGQVFGEIVKLTKTSPDRIQPNCKICHQCGGCEFQQYAYAAELEFKRKLVKEQFRKIASMDVEVPEVIGMGVPEYYRNKIQMSFALDEKGRTYAGFYKKGTHTIVPVSDCKIESKLAQPIINNVCRLMDEYHIDSYDERSHQGIMRHILIRTTSDGKKAMVVFVTKGDSFPKSAAFVADLIKKCPFVVTIVQNINPRETNVILGDKEKTLYGKGYLMDTICGLKFKVSPKSFFQTNPIITNKLYSYAVDQAELTGNEIILDAYSGVGTIGLIASKRCKEVISVELVPEAVRDAKVNARENGITNFKVFNDDASSFISRMAGAKERIDVLFMDPPRKGSDKRFLDSVLKSKPKRIVYVSCDPSTLARDVAYISNSYSIKSIQPFDMFPRSTHVETVVLLQIK